MQIKIFNSRKLNDTREFNLDRATSNLKGECFIGRSPASSLVLDSADVSRLHGKFLQQSGNYYFIDIGSRNGSIINGRLAEIDRKYLLKPGDIVRIGEFLLILEEMDVLRQDLADTVFGSIDTAVVESDKFADVPSDAIASTDEIITSPTEVVETSTQVAVIAEDINEKSLADPTFIQSSISSNIETATCNTQPLPEVEIFTSSDTLTEAEKMAIGDRPTHIEAADENPQFLVTNLKELDPLPISNTREVASILELDLWQDLELESEIAPVLTQNIAVVKEKIAAPNTASTITTEKYMALMAHDLQKPELVQFVAQHQAFFSQHLTIATPSTSVTLQQAGLKVTAETPALPIGGYQAIANLANSGNILAVILLEDVLELPPSEQENQAALIRACNLNQVLLATNISTAEAIVHYIKELKVRG